MKNEALSDSYCERVQGRFLTIGPQATWLSVSAAFAAINA